jgi:Protein of unknown function (DUF5132)
MMAIKLLPDLGNLVEDVGIPGIAAVVFLPIIIPGVGKVVKPMAKAAIKGGIVFYEKSKGVFSEVGETWEDLVAEAKAEIAEAQEKGLEAASETAANADG